MYNHFTHIFNDVLSRQLMNMTTHLFLYSLINVTTYHLTCV